MGNKTITLLTGCKVRNSVMQADYINSVYQTPYQGAWQLGEKDKFLLSNSDGILLVYDEENDGSPKFLS